MALESLLPPGSERIISRAEIDRALDQLAAALNRDFAGQPVLFLTVMNGALIFAADLAQRLELDMVMDYMQASRYGNETEGGILEWVARPRKPMQGRHVLIVDDIYDEGHTVEAIKKFCKAQQAASVSVVVMAVKDHPREKADTRPDYVGLTVPDRFVFGYGMDYQEKLRQLPEIYALGEPS